jgi:hypothetical protein
MKMTLPQTAGMKTLFEGTWNLDYSVAGGRSTLSQGAGGIPTLIFQLNTTDVVNGDTITIFGNSVLTGTTALLLDVSSVSGQRTINLKGVLLTSGIGTVDQPDTDPLVRTLTQYSNSYQGAATGTIDAINNAAQLFSGAVTAHVGGSIKIDSSAAFGGPTSNAPTFEVGDQLQLTLTDSAYGFQGFANVIFCAGTSVVGQIGAITKTVSQATNNVYTLTAAQLAAFDPSVGNNGRDININNIWVLAGNTQVAPRSIALSDVKLLLNATGNGTADLGNYGTVLNVTQNGTLYRCNYMRNVAGETTQNAFYKFSNDSGAAIKVEMRYHGMNDTLAIMVLF